jgi:hypothetical protein
MRIPVIGLLIFPLLTAVACQRQPDPESLRAEILQLHRSFIQAHLDKDAAFLARPTSPEYLSVSDGQVQQMDAKEMEGMLSEYLTTTAFSEYRDVADPIIGVSRDGSLAWAIVQMRVAGTRSMPDRSSRAFDTLWAWITLYRRTGDQWLRIVDVSTNRPFNGTS